MKKLGKLLKHLLIIWLIFTVVTCLLYPGLQKKPPEIGNLPTAKPAGTEGEWVRCIDDNQEALLRRLQVIESAEEDLMLATYNLGHDDAGKDIMSALMMAARRGVRVRMLVDGFCSLTSDLPADRSFQALAAEPNVEIKIYNPVGLLNTARNNYRMHDKYLIADRDVYIMGGRNTTNVSLGSYPGKQDVDRDLLIYTAYPEGSVSQILKYFEDVWAQEICSPVKPLMDGSRGAPDLMKRYEDLQNSLPEAFGETDFTSFSLPAESVRMIYNPIGAVKKAPVLWTQLVEIMKQGQNIEVQTPYIILSEQMEQDLREICADRDFYIITNAPESGANPLGCADFLNHKKSLLRSGIHICEYAGNRSAHVKTVLIDDHLSAIGSFNFDMRSAYLDTEMMAVIESRELNAALRKENDQYIEKSLCTLSDGTEILGKNYDFPRMGTFKHVLYGLLRAVSVPIRHLL